MSGTTPNDLDGGAPANTDGFRELVASRASYREYVLSTPVQFAGFWAAVILPFCYVPLVADGLTGAEPTIFVALLALNVVALLAGHSYKQ